MKRLVFLLFISPLLLSSQICYTENNVTNADSVVYCVTNTSCYNACDGVISITVYGDNQPYFFEWFNSSTPWQGISIQDTLCPGDYIITITDVNGNLVNNSHVNTVDGPPNFSVFEEDVVDPSCFNYSDGFIDLTIAGATPFDIDGVPNSGDEYYTYLWEDGTNTEDRTSLDSGVYVISITDANGCIRVDSFELFNPSEILSATLSNDVSCLNTCDGTASVAPISGIPPFTFLWSNGDTTFNALNLCYGDYSVIITDNNACFNSDSVFIDNPDTLKISSLSVDSACYNICDGEISISIEGGSLPYNISWMLDSSVIDTLNTTINNLCPDVYTLVFSDANNCIETENIVLYERDSFMIQSTVVNDSCFNSCKGRIEVNVLNIENPPLVYNWSNGVNNSNFISDLCVDTFNVEILDDRLCRDTFEFIVSQPLPIQIDSFFVVDNECYNDLDGSIIVNLSGGTGVLQSSWSGINGFSSNDEDISNLPSGSYSLHIEDDYFCTKDTIFLVIEPDSLFTLSSVQNVSCFSFSDGIASITVQGGVSPYSISWNSILSDSLVVDSLIASDYIFTVTDSNGCFFIDTAIVSQPDELIISDSITNVLCKGYHTGNIDLSISGGTPSYSFLWNNLETNEDLQLIGEGVYSVTVTDINQCVATGNYLITEPQFALNASILGTNVLCFGENTGIADLSVSGGTGSYEYQWSNAEVSEDIDSLFAGTYTVNIVDSNGCDTISSIDILENSEIITSYALSNVLCHGDSTGSINILSTIGGSPPYTYNSSNGFSSNTITTILLEAGQYTLVINDDNNCIETIPFNILDALEIISSVSISNIDCYGDNDGSINFNVNGGTGIYTFLWSNNETTEDIDNLSAGQYTVTLTDENGCIISDTAVITEPEEMILLSSIQNSFCHGEALGSIDISVSGGTGGISYNWSNSETSEDLNNITAGNYSLDIIDANNCVVSETFTITEPLAFLDIFNVTDVDCYGSSTGSIEFILTGNTPPYIFNWDNGMNLQNIDNLMAGEYSVFVLDSNNCSETFEVSVAEPEELILNYTTYNASCEENNDGSILTNVSGGTMPYTYYWSNGLYESDLLNLSKGFYTLEIRDANSCIYNSETIEVSFDGYDGCIEIPTGFTPNNDGIHDEWAIYGLYNFPDVIVSIHNRWGQRVFYSEGYTVPWDGKKNGVDLPIAAYYYVIEFTDSGKIFNGTVTIKR